MAIGKGLVASLFNNYSNNNEILFFASGVSNSKCTSKIEFEREFKLLNNTIDNNFD